MPRTYTTATLRRRAAQARVDAIRADSVATLAERAALDASATLAAMRAAETPLLYRSAEKRADDAATAARQARRRATAAKRRATLADARLAEREREERDRLAYRARLIACGACPIPDDDDDARDAIADAAEALLADPGAMIGHGERDALRALLDALGRGDLGEE